MMMSLPCFARSTFFFKQCMSMSATILFCFRSVKNKKQKHKSESRRRQSQTNTHTRAHTNFKDLCLDTEKKHEYTGQSNAKRNW